MGMNVLHIRSMLNDHAAVLQQSLHESFAPYEDCAPTGPSSTGEPTLDDQAFEPIRFIAVGGPYHTGSTVSIIWTPIAACATHLTLSVFRTYGTLSMPTLRMVLPDQETYHWGCFPLAIHLVGFHYFKTLTLI
jgi:hypothetical protein